MVPPTPIRRRADDQDELEQRPAAIRRHTPSALDAAVTPDERSRAAIVDARAANEGVHRTHLRQRRFARVLLGQSRLLRALKRGQVEGFRLQLEHRNALADLEAAMVLRDARQARAVTAVVTTSGAKVAAPLTVFFVVVEILKLVFGG